MTDHILSYSRLGALFVVTLTAMEPFSVQAAHPHIVVIVVDDMGYGDAGCYNANSKIPTPNIDSIAKTGMRFTDAHAPGPLCHMSRYGLLTGCYPFRTNVGRWRTQPLIRKRQLTIASLLKDAGYRTEMVGKWHLGFDEMGYDKRLAGGPVDRGFDHFFGIRASTDIPPYFYIRDDAAVQPPTDRIAANRSQGWSPIQGAFWRAGGIAPNLALKDVLPRFTDEAVRVIRDHSQRRPNGQQDEQPLMLYLAYPAPHTPWLPSKEFKGKSKAGMYGDFTAMVDAMIGRVLKTLEQAGMANDTLLVMTSDNGPVWYERDVQRFQHDSSGGLRGMKADAWECGHRMPFLVRWPGKVKPGTVTAEMICFTDLLATFASLVQKPIPAGEAMDSFDFSSVLLGTQPAGKPVRDSLVIPSGSGMMTIREGNWKLIAGLGSGGFSQPKRSEPAPGGPQGQLYDLGTDPGELHNRYLEEPEIVKRLTMKLSEIRANGHRVRGPSPATRK